MVCALCQPIQIQHIWWLKCGKMRKGSRCINTSEFYFCYLPFKEFFFNRVPWRHSTTQQQYGVNVPLKSMLGREMGNMFAFLTRVEEEEKLAAEYTEAY